MIKIFNVLEARDWITGEKNLQLIDVRSQEEFSKGAIPGFINIPLEELSKELPNLNAKKKALVICEDGSSSKKAQQLLQACGIDTYSVRGGISDWRKVISQELTLG